MNSPLKKLGNIVKGYTELLKKKVGVTNEEKEKVAKMRYLKCQRCDRRDKKKDTCKVCGCFLPAKVRSLDSECPKGKW